MTSMCRHGTYPDTAQIFFLFTQKGMSIEFFVIRNVNFKFPHYLHETKGKQGPCPVYVPLVGESSTGSGYLGGNP